MLPGVLRQQGQKAANHQPPYGEHHHCFPLPPGPRLALAAGTHVPAEEVVHLLFSRPLFHQGKEFRGAEMKHLRSHPDSVETGRAQIAPGKVVWTPWSSIPDRQAGALEGPRRATDTALLQHNPGLL